MSLRTKVNELDHIEGLETAKIEIVEYGDYECPYCREAYYSVKDIQKTLGDKIKFVFRNFPLGNIHPNAVNAAIVSEVAAVFGKFWEMHDMLYENQENLEYDNLIEYADKLGIKTDEFENEFKNNKYIDKINTDIESGLRSGVNGTPTFFINGKKYNGNPYLVEEFLEDLNELL